MTDETSGPTPAGSRHRHRRVSAASDSVVDVGADSVSGASGTESSDGVAVPDRAAAVPDRAGRADRGVVYLLPTAASAAPVEPTSQLPAPMLPASTTQMDAPAGSGAMTAAGLVESSDPRPVHGLHPDAPAGRVDWAWVQEWRAGREPTPWAPGLGLSAFFALVVGVAVWLLSAVLADHPIVAVAINLLVAVGLGPAMWLSRDLPVLRWIAAGALVGIIVGWIAAVLMLPLPPP